MAVVAQHPDDIGDIWPGSTVAEVALALVMDDSGMGGFREERIVRASEQMVAHGVHAPSEYVLAVIRRAAVIRGES